MDQRTADFVHYAGPDRYETLIENVTQLVHGAEICSIPGCDNVTAVFETSVPICQAHAAQVERDMHDWMEKHLRSAAARLLLDDNGDQLDDEQYSPAQQALDILRRRRERLDRPLPETYQQAKALKAYIEAQSPAGRREVTSVAEPEATPAVYYILMNDWVKIGTTVNLARRLRTFAVHPDALLAVEPGSYAREAERHTQFRHLRQKRTELFKLDAKLQAHIDAVRATFGDPKQFL